MSALYSVLKKAGRSIATISSQYLENYVKEIWNLKYLSLLKGENIQRLFFPL